MKDIKTLKEIIIELADVIQSVDFDRRYWNPSGGGKERELTLVQWIKAYLEED